ncbi:MAG: penicillin-binding transpeptidase domain-containing protein [Planctomycetaceae bacterium]
MKLGWRGSARNTSGKENVPRPSRVGRARRFYVCPLLGALGFFLVVSWTGLSFLQAAKKDHRAPASLLLAGLGSSQVDGSSPSFQKIVDGKFVEHRGSYQFIYTVDPILQASVEEVFRAHKPPFGTFVALDPKTGKILALAEYSRDKSGNGGIWNRSTYPAASVFKIITAACALEKGVLHYDSSVSFKGNQYRLGPGKINRTSKWEHQTQFDDALGKSNNVVFGRVASKLVGSETLRQYSSAFGFNQSLPFDFPVAPSKAVIPEESYELARCGAGFGEVTLNPLHGALIAAAIANRGIMMRPYLIEQVRGEEGEILYEAQAIPWAHPISAQTAQDLTRMMRRTVEDGTASRTFQRYGKDLIQKVTVSGKTGSLSGDDPPGLYDWFVGFATTEDPQVAFSAMAINYQRNKFRGAFIAQEALKIYFRKQLN